MTSLFLPGEDCGGARGQTIYTGPNGVSDYKAHVVADYEYVGETVANNSSTTSMKFLSREPQDASYPPRRKQYVGEVGWMVQDDFMNSVNEDALKSGNQIQLKVYRKALEESKQRRQTGGIINHPSRGVSGYEPGMDLMESQGLRGAAPPRAETTSSSSSSTFDN